MKRFFVMPALLVGLMSNYCLADDLDELTMESALSCAELSIGVRTLLSFAKANTGVAAAGTIGAGVALGAGIRENKLINEKTQGLSEDSEQDSINDDEKNTKKQNSVDNKIDNMDQVKFGGLIVSGVSNSMNIITSLQSRSDSNIDFGTKEWKEDCPAKIKELVDMRLQAKVEKTADSDALKRAEKIISACRDFENVDWKKIDNPAIWAAVASGVGAGTAIGGLITSVKGNIADNTEKQQQLNKTSNVLSGASAVASATATVLNASQISAVKKVAVIAEECIKAASEVQEEMQNNTGQ